MHSLRQYLLKRLGTHDPLVRCQYACAVLMPDCCFEAEGSDIIPEILFDTHTNWNLDDVVKTAFSYWRGLCLSRHGFQGSHLSEEEIYRLGNILRGDFHFVSSMKAIIDRTAKELCALTDEQYEVLESLSDNPRTLVSGVAGSGKTLIAAEQARRAYWEGKTVLYLCFNKSIAQYVASVFSKENADITAVTLHALMMQVCGIEWSEEYGSDWYETTLPSYFLSQESVPSFDLVIIDEGQDLLADSYYKCIDRLISKGFKNGKWAVFYDPNQNIFNNYRDLSSMLARLRTETSVASWKLSINCRNTKQIANANILLTNIPEQGKTRVSGPQVEYISYSGQDDARAKISAIIRNLRDSGVVGGDFIILSKYTLLHPKNSIGTIGLDKDLGTIKASGQMWRAKKNEIRFSTVASFKGLDAKIVILSDIDQFSSEEARLLNYVAASRACAKLYILYDSSSETERQQMISSGVSLII